MQTESKIAEAPEAAEAVVDAAAEATDADRVDALAQLAPTEAAAPAATPRLSPGLRTGELVAAAGAKGPRKIEVRLRGRLDTIDATLAPEVDREIFDHAAEAGQSALIEIDEDGAAWIVGLVQTRVAEKIVLHADSVVLKGDSEIVLESGKAGMRLREDGDVELVGSRIMHMSRGLFRIVGRMLRLN